MMAEDYSDLDPNKVVLSFRGDVTTVNCIDRSLKEIAIRRLKEAEAKAMQFTPSDQQTASVETPPQKTCVEVEEQDDIEIK